MVSKGCEAVTAPQAAMPPAMKEPVVVAMGSFCVCGGRVVIVSRVRGSGGSRFRDGSGKEVV